MTIKITFKDGTVREWKEQSRPGGSYDHHVDYEGGFVIVKDIWDVVNAFPAQDVKEVETRPRYR